MQQLVIVNQRCGGSGASAAENMGEAAAPSRPEALAGAGQRACLTGSASDIPLGATRFLGVLARFGQRCERATAWVVSSTGSLDLPSVDKPAPGQAQGEIPDLLRWVELQRSP